MEKLSDLLKPANSVSYSADRLDKNKRPPDFPCPKCEDHQVSWFWLESEIPELTPSHWERHLCLCMVIYKLRSRRSYFSFGLNREEVTEADTARANAKIKVINHLIRLISECKSPADYYQRRLEIAKETEPFGEDGKEIPWDMLFDCYTEEQADFFNKVLAAEQPV